MAKIAGLPCSDPSKTGLDPAPFAEVRLGVRKAIDAGRMAGGCCSLVAHKGKLIHVDSYNAPVDATGSPVGPDTMMRLYSMCKTYAAIATMILCDEGKIKLDDPVGKYLPSWSNVRVGPNKIVASPQPTIRHLITHTCGMGYLTMPKENKPSNTLERKYAALCRRCDTGKIRSLGAFVDELAKVPLKLHPGKTWEYGFGFDVVGRVIEVVSGMPYAEFLEKRVFKPLNMKDSGFHVPRNKAHKIGQLYRTVGKKRKRFEVDDPKPVNKGVSDWVSSRPPAVVSPGGMLGDDRSKSRGLVSTAEDTLRFCLMLRNGGVSRETGKRILKSTTVKLLLQNWLPMPTVTGRTHEEKHFGWGRGLGFSPLGQIGVYHPKKDTWASTRGLNKMENLEGEVGHGGWAITYWGFDPIEDVCQVFFCQHPEAVWKENMDPWHACRKAIQRVSRRNMASVKRAAAKMRIRPKKTLRQVARSPQ